MTQLMHHMIVKKFVTKSGLNPKGFHKTGDNSYAFDVDLMEHDDVVCRLNDGWFETFGGPEDSFTTKDGQAVAWALDEIVHTTAPTPSMMVKITICPINQISHVVSAEAILAAAEPDTRPFADFDEAAAANQRPDGDGEPEQAECPDPVDVKPELPKVGDIVQSLQRGGGYTGKVIEVNDLGIEVEWHKGIDNVFTDVIWFGGDLIPTWDKTIKIVTSPVDREWWPGQPDTTPLVKASKKEQPSGKMDARTVTGKCGVEGCTAMASLRTTDGQWRCDKHFREEHGKRLVEARQSMKKGLQPAAHNPNHPNQLLNQSKPLNAATLPKKPKAERKPKVEKPVHPCACGCGQGTKSIFKMGHDAKAKKMLRMCKLNLDGKQLAPLQKTELGTWKPGAELVKYINDKPAWLAEFAWVNGLK